MIMSLDRIFINLVRITTVLAFVVIVSGAYVRLSDAGLSCPDWPGCYGQIIVPANQEAVLQANEVYPDQPLEKGKAWKEMIHRYAAGILGLLALTLAIMAWVNRATPGQQVWIPTIILLLVIFQALLGMWTVTLLLKGASTENRLRAWTIAGLVIVVMQVSLGGWTSSNYAALACPDFPTCQGTWWPKMDFSEGFKLWRGLGVDYEGGILSGEARTAIHMTHRLGAILVLFVVGAVAIRAILDKSRSIARTGKVLITVLFVQIGLGISNVVQFLPLPIAVAHNAMAALLLLCLVTLIHYAVPLTHQTGEPLG